MQRLDFKDFNTKEHSVWSVMFTQQAQKRDDQIHPLFSEGILKLGLNDKGIPHIDEVNKKLKSLTGFAGVPVEGLEEPESFFEMLSNREFPIGNFIRSDVDSTYTPAPDIFHDLYGHLPFLANKEYADFCCDLGRRAVKAEGDAKAIRQWERLFWFAVEFSLIKQNGKRLIFGAGIASSVGECAYALSDKPQCVPFDIYEIRKREYNIDEYQKTLFVLENPQQLYSCLDAYEKATFQALEHIVHP